MTLKQAIKVVQNFNRRTNVVFIFFERWQINLKN